MSLLVQSRLNGFEQTTAALRMQFSPSSAQYCTMISSLLQDHREKDLHLSLCWPQERIQDQKEVYWETFGEAT